MAKLVRSEDGSVDVQASTAAYAAELTEKLTARAAKAAEKASAKELPSEATESAIDAVLGRYPEDQRLPMPALTAMVVTELNTPVEQFAAASKAVQAALRARRDAGTLSISKGAGGGVSRSLEKKSA